MSAALNPRRWFRFRLRTVLLLIALLAIPCAWLGSEWKLVRERAALLSRVDSNGGRWFSWDWVDNGPDPRQFAHEIVIEPGSLAHVRPSLVREWMGDRDVGLIRIPEGFSDDDEKRILDLFPHAEVVKFFPDSTSAKRKR